MGGAAVGGNVELFLLSILVGITLLAYLIAINSHGPTRLSVSYLVATLMLAGTVLAIVQHVNSGADRLKAEQIEKLKMARMEAEERVRTQEVALRENKKKMEYAAKLNAVITQGTGLSTQIMNVDLRDFSAELDVLLGRAATMNTTVASLKKEYAAIEKETAFFAESKQILKDAFEQLETAANYYRLYYRSEDSAQEELRERMMRQRARKSYELFKSAASEIIPDS